MKKILVYIFVFIIIIYLFIWYRYITYVINKSASNIANDRNYCWVVPVSDGFSPEYEYRLNGGIFFPPIYRTLKTLYFTDYGKRPIHFGIYIPIQKKYSYEYFYRWEYGEGSFWGGELHQTVFHIKENGPGSYNFCLAEIEKINHMNGH